jgi:hypothetical protein
MAAEELTQSLRGTAWQGSFTALGKTSALRIVFLSKLSVDGALLYFHRLMGNVPVEIEGLDRACKFTPRMLKLETSSASNSASGTISVFKCADSEREESELEKDINRHPVGTVRDVRVSISASANALEIIANIKGIEVTYKLTRQAISTDAALRAWLQDP